MTTIQNLRAACCIASIWLGGCAVGPDFHRPAAPSAIAYEAEPSTRSVDDTNAEHLNPALDIPAQWWEVFHSPALNDLIEKALQANPSITAAQAALRAAQENVYAQQGAYFPSVTANFNPTRQKTSGALSSVPSSGAYIYSLHTAQVNVSYTPDVFGANHRAVESLQAQAESQRFQLEATRLTLISNLVAAAVQEASLRAQIAATEAIIEDQSKTLASFKRQFELGQLAQLDVATQQAALSQAQATLPPLRKQLAQQCDLIKALAGLFPDAPLAAQFELAALKLPAELPLSLPSKLVEQRPDIRAAEAQMHAASAQIGVAIANRLPNISIDGNLGSSAATIGNLFNTGTAFWSIAGNITQPIFDGGTLLHRQRSSEAAYDQAAAQYRSTVISALQNVADVLHAIESDTEALNAALVAEQSAARLLDIAKRLLELGSIDTLNLLQAEQTWQQARINLIQAQSNRLSDAVALFQALGGGWSKQPEAADDALATSPPAKH